MKVKLTYIADVVSGATPSTKHTEYYDGNIIWATPKDLSDQHSKYFTKGERNITKQGLESCSASMIPPGNILMSSRAPIGLLAINTVPCCTNQGFKSFILDHSKCDTDYFYYYLKYHIQEIEALAGGTTFKEVSKTSLEKLEIELPPLNIQKDIGKFLSTLDSRIINNNDISSQLESMAKTIYDYWFLQFDFPDKNGRPYQASGGKMVWNDELKREIPEGWKVYHAKDCIEHINTGLNPRQNFKLGNGDIKYITVKNLTVNGTIDWSTCDTIDEKAREIVHRRSDVSKGDILFASIAPLGRCVLVQEDPETWDINESVFCIRPNYHLVTSEYLYMFLMSDGFIKQAEHSSTGSVFSGIRIGTLGDMPLLVPSKTVLNSFTSKISEILYDKYRNEQENRQLSSLRDFLLPMLMNGQVSFKNQATKGDYKRTYA